MSEDLSERQKQILKFIIESIRRDGYPPSVREIGKGVGLKSSSTVHSHLSTLEEKGYIRKGASKPRAIEVVGMRDEIFPESSERETVEVPVVGEVTAGEPILAVENITDHLPLPLDFVRARNKELFMLTIKGDSMVNAGIFDGDYALIEKTDTARDGDIVVALLEDEATVKRFKRDNGKIWLIPENDTMEPFSVDTIDILGRVIGIFRMMD